MKKLILTIPEPCHEDWNKMTPDDKGRFCSSCNKSVHDLTNKTDQEIYELLKDKESGKVCGHVKNTQLNRPLSFQVPMHLLPTNVSPFRAFAMALFLVFGTTLFSCTNDKKQPIAEITAVQPMHSEQVKQILDEKMPEEMIGYSVPVVRTDVTPLVEKSCSFSGGAMVMREEQVVTNEMVPRETIVDGGLSYRYVDVYQMPEEVHHHVLKEIPQEIGSDDLPKEISLQTYPNPSNGNINISYEVFQKENVEITLLDLNGVLVRTIVSAGEQYEGKYVIPTDLSDLADGIYICRIVNNGKEKTSKIILTK